MANICMARITVLPLDDGPNAAECLPDALKARLEPLSYDHFGTADEEKDRLEIECGFRWQPPFEQLLAVTADMHVYLRCLYEEQGCAFMGAWVASDGKVLQDECIDYL